jgi:hypothetical protein
MTNRRWGSSLAFPVGAVLVSLVCVAAAGFGAATAFGQALGDVTSTVGQVTSTVGSVVDDTSSTAEDVVEGGSGTATDAVEGGSKTAGDAVGAVSGGGSPSLDGPASGGGGSSGGGSSGGGSSGQSPSAGDSATSSAKGSWIPDTCAEAARDPTALARYMATFKDEQASGLAAGDGSDGGRGAGVAGAQAEGPPDIAIPAPSIPPGDFWHSPLAILAWAAVGLGIAGLLTSAVWFWTGRWNP